MKIKHEILFYLFLIKTSIKDSINKRLVFIFEVLLMIINNLIFFSIWWIFFLQFKGIGDWHMREMMILMTIVSGAFGLTEFCFGGLRLLARKIVKGELDPYLTRPKNSLLYILGSKSLPKGAGYLLTALLLGGFGNLGNPYEMFLIIYSIITGCIVFTSAGIIAHSLVFWLGPTEILSKRYCDSLFLFVLYPTNIYSGFTQIIMYSLLPAAVIGYLPVELIRSFSWETLLTITAATLFLFVLALIIFYAGLKRYESGNQIEIGI